MESGIKAPFLPWLNTRKNAVISNMLKTYDGCGGLRCIGLCGVRTVGQEHLQNENRTTPGSHLQPWNAKFVKNIVHI